MSGSVKINTKEGHNYETSVSDGATTRVYSQNHEVLTIEGVGNTLTISDVQGTRMSLPNLGIDGILVKTMTIRFPDKTVEISVK